MPQTITWEKLKGDLDSGTEVHLIEVLAKKEYDRLHIKGAENIPLPTIAAEAKKKYNKDDYIVVYCADAKCSASPQAAEKLETFGFTNVYDYVEGKADWKKAGYPMEGMEAS